MKDKNSDFLRQAVEILQGHEVENFLIIAESMEVFQSKKDNLSFILDAFVSLGHLDKTGQQEQLEQVLERLRRE